METITFIIRKTKIDGKLNLKLAHFLIDQPINSQTKIY